MYRSHEDFAQTPDTRSPGASPRVPIIARKRSSGATTNAPSAHVEAATPIPLNVNQEVEHERDNN